MKSHALGATAFILSAMTFCIAPRLARGDEYQFNGTATLVPNNEQTGDDTPAFTVNQQGSWGDPTVWDGPQLYDPPVGDYSSSAPGPGDGVSIQGYVPSEFPPDPSGVITPNEFLSRTGTGFNVSGASGTVAFLGVAGPGTLSLGSLSVTGFTTFESVGGIPDYDNLDNVTGYEPSAQTISGGSLSTPALELGTGTSLAPGNGVTSEVPDPVADAGSLTISGATLSGDVTGVIGAVGSYGFFAGNPDQFKNVPVMLNDSMLNAKTELDIIGDDPSVAPDVMGMPTLAASGSTITAGAVVIATGAGVAASSTLQGVGAYGTGAAGAAAALTLDDGSILNANSAGSSPPSLVVGDTGDGVLSVTGGSTVNAQQSVIGNAADATGNAAIDGSTWNNASFLTIGNFGEGTLNVQNSAKVTSSDVMYVGLNGDSMGTLNISAGGTVTTSTTGIDGPNSMVVGTDADSTGTVSIDGTGSQLESTGDAQIGYSGTGSAFVTDGGALIVDGTLFRVGHNEGGTGTLGISGSGSSVTASNATIYVGYGGTGTVDDFDGASLTVMATNIGGQSTGDGTLNIDGMGTQATLGDVTVGDAGNGMLTVTGGATVNTGDITIGAQSDESNAAINAAPIANMGYMLVDGANTQVIADGDMIVGDQNVGFIEAGDGAMLRMNTLTVGNGGTGNGQFNVVTGATVTVANDTTVAAEEDSQGNIDVDGTGSKLTITGDLTVGGGGTATLTVSGNSTVSNQGAVVGNDDTSVGTVEITGTGSIWHSGGDVTIGENGTGTVTAEAGGTLQVDGDLTLGLNEDSQGTLVFDGAMTKAIFGGGDVTIGSSGTGTMNVQNGVFVDLSGNEVKLGDEETGNGGLLVTDAGTMLNTGELTVGGSGSGTLIVQNGGALSTGDTTIGDEFMGNGLATVMDDGSTWTTSGLTVGGSGTGTLQIEDGGSVTVNNTEFSIGDTHLGEGTVTLNGTGSALSFNGKLEIGEQGTGLFAVQAGASFTANSVEVGDQPVGTGTLNVDGNGTMMEVKTDFNIGEQGTGMLNVTNGAKLTSDLNTTLADMAKSSATATVDTLGSWSIGGTLTVGGQSMATLTVSGGGNVSAANVTIGDQSGSSTVTVTGASATGAPPKPSTLQFSGILTVANGSFGELDITQGAQVMTFGDSQPDVDILPDGNGGYTIVGTPIRAIDIGSQQVIVGIVKVSGTGSGITADVITAGVNGAGSMTVSGGASGTAHLATVVGYQANSDGTLDIFGNGLATGNTSYQAGALEVGDYGTGNMTVNGGAVVSATTLDVGEIAGSSAVVTITGPNSSINGSGRLVVGNQGTGNITVTGGGTLFADSALIGGAPSDLPVNAPLQGTGTVALKGAGTAMTLAGDLQVGSINLANLSWGNGEVQIFNGATVTNQNAILDGFQSSLPANIDLEGSANGFPSAWTTKGDLTVGQNFTGFVNVTSGALMVVDGNLIVGQNILANSNNTETGQSVGEIIVRNPGTTFNDFGASMTIGAAGQGDVTVIEGAQASFSSAVVTLGQNSATSTLAAGRGELDVGSLLDTSPSGSMVTLNSLVVGDAGVGTLVVGKGATLVSHSSSLVVGNQFGANGTVTMNGILSQLVLNSGATVDVGLNGTGVFTIQNSATFDADKFVIGENTLSTGTANVTGTGTAGSAVLQYDDTLIVGDNGNGTLNVSAGGLVEPSGTGAGNVVVGNQSFGIGSVVVQGSTSHFEANTLVVGGPGGGLGSSGGGSFELLTGASAHAATSVMVGNAGELDVAGTLIEIGGITSPAFNGGGLTIGSTATLAAANQVLVNIGGTLGGIGDVYGTVTVNGGTLAPTVQLVTGGPLVGSGNDTGSVTDDSLMDAPLNQPTLTIIGDYVQAGGVLDFEVDGSDPGHYGHLDVTGDLNLAGNVELHFDDGFAPSIGDIYDLITTGTASDFNPAFEIAGLEPGWQYKLQQAADGDYEVVSLSNGIALPVPEPTSVALLCGVGLLVSRRWRRNAA